MSKLAKKLIIYLDQNFISDIAKLREGINNRTKPELDLLFQEIKQGVDEEKFVVPDSPVIKEETAAFVNERLIEATRSHQKYLGQVSLLRHWEIIDGQFKDHLFKYLDKKDDIATNWESAFREDPDKRMTKFSIDVRFKNFDIPDSQTQYLQQIRDKGVRYEDQYYKEIHAAKKGYIEKLKKDYSFLLCHNNISFKQAEEFIKSDHFNRIPFIDIFCRLWAKDLSQKGRVGKKSDGNDIDMLSAYLPYCDIIATDSYMVNLVKSLKLDTDYDCMVYSLKDQSLGDLINRLREARKNTKPANRSMFSVVCLQSIDRGYFNSGFIDKMNLARNKFLNTGKNWNKELYVSVFFAFSKKESLMPNIIKKDKKYYLKMDERSISDMKIFGYNFDEIELKGEAVEKRIKKMPDFLKGKATAIITEKDIFDYDLPEHDSKLFFDIEEAISNHKDTTERYKIKIIY